MVLEFKQSKSLSLGVELELQLINLNNYNLSHDAEDLLRRLSSINLPGEIKPEITKSMIEINSSIHQHPDTLQIELTTLKHAMVKEARKIDLGIAGGGTHPFQKWKDRQIFPSERFINLFQMYGYLSKLFTVFGQHIHIGCSSGDQAINMIHAYALYIPHFIALSASSPYYQDMDSDFDTCRLNVISSFPTSGTIPTVKSWREFEEYYNKLVEFKIISSIKDLYWDIRPKPEFGTVEIRICDTPLQISKAVTLAAYAQALGAYIINNQINCTLEDIYLVYNYNKFQAAKFGLDAVIIDPITKNKVSIHDDILAMLEKLNPYVADLNLNNYMQSIREATLSRTNDAKIIRSTYDSLKSFPDLVSKQVNLWENNA